ncbi:SDR family oxidoreductase [Baekduia soli]|uniref:SDR family oxidoreductase n=1 Tax=Baekduia soli TaxID=496014 RepID=A0A5B8U519_9ACTN|nr:SDR family oxidoreductase [Baekduia soli]QEC47985.1 SDR family oxidoreductase [Baekduia soli]
MSNRRRPSPSQRTVDGRTAVITGAGSGIGAAVARRLAAHGCPVALADRDEDGLAATAEAIGGGDRTVLTRALDVRDRQGLMAFAAEVAAWAPQPLGMVFNNAGVTAVQGVADSAPEDDEWVHEVNFGGVVHGVRAFLPILLAQGSGAIVNTSSVFGLVGFPHQSAYCASKFAVRGYTEALRHELRGTGVRAVVVHPGGVRTNIVRNSRYRADFGGRNPTLQEAVADFDALARTTPERAAEIIHSGVNRGRARILVGHDAHLFDALARIAPARAYDVLHALEPLARLGQTRVAA